MFKRRSAKISFGRSGPGRQLLDSAQRVWEKFDGVNITRARAKMSLLRLYPWNIVAHILQKALVRNLEAAEHFEISNLSLALHSIAESAVVFEQRQIGVTPIHCSIVESCHLRIA